MLFSMVLAPAVDILAATAGGMSLSIRNIVQLILKSYSCIIWQVLKVGFSGLKVPSKLSLASRTEEKKSIEKSLVQKLPSFNWRGKLCLLVKLHWEGSAINGAIPSSFHKLREKKYCEKKKHSRDVCIHSLDWIILLIHYFWFQESFALILTLL